MKYQLKYSYVESTQENFDNDPKRIQKSRRELRFSEKAKKSNVKMPNGKINDQEKANELDKSFSTIGSFINKSIITDAKLENYLPDLYPPILYISTVDFSQMSEAINELN